MLYVCLCAEAGAFLVRHRRSWILSEPRPRSQDETLGEVNLHLNRLWDIVGTVSAVPSNLLPLMLWTAFPIQRWHFYGNSWAHPSPWWLHRRLHRWSAARREPHPLCFVPLAPGEPGTGVGHTQPGTYTHTYQSHKRTDPPVQIHLNWVCFVVFTLGDAQLRHSGKQQKHCQPERSVFNKWRSYKVKCVCVCVYQFMAGKTHGNIWCYN